jgi:hypothetical protein
MMMSIPDATGRCLYTLSTLTVLCAFASLPAAAASFTFITGNPDGKIATLSRQASGTTIQTETADDFILGQSTLLTSATFTGLLPSGSPVSNISQVEIEFYHVFPADSANPPSGNAFTRANSPADVEIASATRDSIAGTLRFTGTVLNPSFTVANTVVNGINNVPNQFTAGEGPTTGEEVQIGVNFNAPVFLPGDHYFFRPEVLLNNGYFLYLSAPKSSAATDLQSWIRNDNLAPDWLRIGTDITHQGPFNAAFSLSGNTVPEPGSLALLGIGIGGMIFGFRRLCKKY